MVVSYSIELCNVGTASSSGLNNMEEMRERMACDLVCLADETSKVLASHRLTLTFNSTQKYEGLITWILLLTNCPPDLLV
jgi:hypothetical protein